MQKILIINCSNSNESINRIVAHKLNEKINAKLIEANNYSVDMYNFSNETNFPNKILEFLDILRSYDLLIFFTPEHNGYIPAFFKNIMDWSSRGKYGMRFLENKNVVIVTVTPGKFGGANVRNYFSNTISFTGAKVLGTVGVAEYIKNKNVDNELDEIIKLI